METIYVEKDSFMNNHCLFGATMMALALNLGCEHGARIVDNAQHIPSQMPQADIPWPSLANSPWPMYLHDPQHTGRSPNRGPQVGQLEWSANPARKTELTTGIAIGQDNTIYFISSAHLVALQPDGTEKWLFKFSDDPGGYGWPSETTPLLTKDGTIYVTSRDDFYLYAIKPDGSLKQRAYTGVRSLDDLVIGLDGRLYGISEDRYLYAISAQGDVFWKLSLDTGFAYWTYPVFSPDGATLYAAGADSGLYAISTSGELLWKNNLEGQRYWKGILVDNQGNVYVQPFDGSQAKIYSFKPDGGLRWHYGYAESVADINTSLTMDKNGYLYFVDEIGKRIISLDYSGKRRWANDDLSGIINIRAPLICDHEGTIYMSFSFSPFNVMAITSEGIIKWSMTLPNSQFFTESPPSIGSNGQLYITGDYERLVYAIR
jgi:outer membrane protein assembly factor BamB